MFSLVFKLMKYTLIYYSHDFLYPHFVQPMEIASIFRGNCLVVISDLCGKVTKAPGCVITHYSGSVANISMLSRNQVINERVYSLYHKLFTPQLPMFERVSFNHSYQVLYMETRRSKSVFKIKGKKVPHTGDTESLDVCG